MKLGEVQQLETVHDEEERFELYLNKSFNKTASLMANSCKANAILSFDHFNVSNLQSSLSPEDAYRYGKNLGIAFQLVDDLLGMNEIFVLFFGIELQILFKKIYSVP